MPFHRRHTPPLQFGIGSASHAAERRPRFSADYLATRPMRIPVNLSCHRPGPDDFLHVSPSIRASIPESGAYYTIILISVLTICNSDSTISHQSNWRGVSDTSRQSDLGGKPLSAREIVPHHLPSDRIRQLAQFFADALGLGFVIMHDGILKQDAWPAVAHARRRLKSLDRLYRTCPPACPP